MLEKKEIEELKNFALTYRDIHIKINNMEKTIEKMNIEKNDLVNQLEYARSKELQFTSDMIEKYGSEFMNSKQIKDVIYSTVWPS